MIGSSLPVFTNVSIPACDLRRRVFQPVTAAVDRWQVRVQKVEESQTQTHQPISSSSQGQPRWARAAARSLQFVRGAQIEALFVSFRRLRTARRAQLVSLCNESEMFAEFQS